MFEWSFPSSYLRVSAPLVRFFIRFDESLELRKDPLRTPQILLFLAVAGCRRAVRVQVTGRPQHPARH
jgi:hypothetical protein